MRKLKLTLGLLLIVALCATAFAAEFDKTVSVTGGSGQRLSAVMTANGYNGGLLLKQLIVCNPAGSANTLYIGNAPTVDATTGFPLSAGACINWSAPEGGTGIDSTQKYLYTATTQNEAISARAF
jgi:hypothetical protein